MKIKRETSLHLTDVPHTSKATTGVKREYPDSESTIGQPAKRRRTRLVLDAVEIPTRVISPPKLKKQCRDVTENMMRAEFHSIIPRLMKKKEATDPEIETIRSRRFRNIPLLRDVNVPEDIKYVAVKREFLGTTYGGRLVPIYPKHKPPYEDMMCITQALNPDAPDFPGASGMLYECCDLLQEAEERAKIRRLFVRGNGGLWIYQGQYAIQAAAPLTKEEWWGQSNKVKMKWAENIIKNKWGRWVRARVILRRTLRSEPSEAELKLALEDTNENFGNVTSKEILRAYNRGQEAISVWTMHCVDYDENFQRDICNKYPGWVPAKKVHKI